ncbi:MAG: DinB-like domain protein [Acidobacteria bacterium]|nr:DinB-like domain protein [Acidobacteriota bacterium]
MRRSILAVPLVVSACVLLGPAVAHAQTAHPDTAARDVLLAQWTEVGDKVVKLAEEFPEDKYEFRPVAGVRSFADQLRHVAFWNGYVAKSARGEKADGKQNELPKADYPTKAAIVAALKSSLAEATALLKNGPETPTTKLTNLWVSFTEHAGEHYGQMVVYYRLNGIVPPASRGQ